jgi:hypothetical protein
MTGSHEVRGSIPLGSTNIIKQLGAANVPPLSRLSHYRVTTTQSYELSNSTLEPFCGIISYGK